ncbi:MULTISPECIES: ABC transporter ATP-binding protein [Bacillus amyloliquefaciens group]|uniref:ABC transporter ATP-binding protein n=1 Tax=Bacillus amyloliquefaciens group TaxID=1938374 RepID=UPI000647298E|nr:MULTISPECIES: ABC transporter ATP-binding protein [Bacillus amyloliquefaciens group]MDQ8091285.1 ABC transporter ATP-binding protein [Bacillus amyloliquefaciens]MDU0812814.1 ABC transporter ATP-binding protein [Bacillus siamensis]MED5048484.1 ABC transporter ATP-binding protein [Bacillus siamensis]MED5096904.1 ABC transporter ATP-binding protein [Bacillus siamensis]
MNKYYNVTLKEVTSSFKNWPSLYKLFIKVDKKSFIQITVLAFISGFIPPLLLLLNQALLNTLQLEIKISNALSILLILIIVYIMQIMVNQYKQYKEEVFSNKLAYFINLEIMRKTKDLTLSDFENPYTYDQIQRVTSESSYRPYQIFSEILVILSSAVTLISTSIIIIIWKWWLVLFLFLTPIISSLFYIKLGKKEYEIEWERTPLRRKLFYYIFLMTRDFNVKEIKLFNLGGLLIERYKKLNIGFLETDNNIARKKLKIAVTFETVNQLIIGVLMLYIIMKVLTKEIMIGTMMALIQGLISTQTSLKTLMQEIFSIYENNLYVNNFFDFIKTKTFNHISETKLELTDINKITFKDVFFKYPNTDNYALKGISFEVEKGETIALVGGNGSGKSTLIKLITRLYKDYQGEILINSIPIEKYSIESVRNQMSVIFQDFVKFEFSIRENIGFGDWKRMMDEDALYKATNISGASKIIKKSANRFDTQLGKMFNDGNQLSGGEWQKIAISRAIFKPASLYIMDEPSSALDIYSEKDLFNKYNSFLKNKIGLFITHRFTTVQQANRILVMEDGKIIECGTHEELLQKKSVYYDLYSSQKNIYFSGYKI